MSAVFSIFFSFPFDFSESLTKIELVEEFAPGGRHFQKRMSLLHTYYWYFYFSPRGFGVGGGV